jgi:hypothetical protein
LAITAYYRKLYADAARKLEAEALASALSVCVTNSNLAGTVGTAYGFAVSSTESGAATVEFGNSGAAFWIKNNSVPTMTELLSRANSSAGKRRAWDVNGDGLLSCAETILRNQADSLCVKINNT